MSSVSEDPALLARPPSHVSPEAPIIVRVARLHGISPLRQLAQMLRLALGRGKLYPQEYYDAALFRPTLDADARAAFVGRRGNLALNRPLSAGDSSGNRKLRQDKLALAALLSGFGLRTPETQAISAASRRFGARPVLRDAAAIEAFLRGPARYPLFLKPLDGSLSVGSTLLTAVDVEAGSVRLGDGRCKPIAALAQEIADTYPRGFLFQTRVAPHPELAAVAGQALGTVRVVTVADTDGPRVLYAVWKLPSRDAMSDSSWQAGNMQALVDLDTGRVLRCGRGTGLEIGTVERHPESNHPLVGLQLPYWKAVMQAACDGHSLLPGCGILGWDVGIDAEGPVLLEANDNPFHMLYQRAADRGILNPDFLPVFNRLHASATAQRRKRSRWRRKARS